MTQKDYSKTKLACYLGFVTQAIVANFTLTAFVTALTTTSCMGYGPIPLPF